MYKFKNWLSEVCWDVGQTFVRWSYALEESAYRSKRPERVDGRTELSDMIYRLTPADTQFTYLLKKEKNSRAEWQTDDLKPDE